LKLRGPICTQNGNLQIKNFSPPCACSTAIFISLYPLRVWFLADLPHASGPRTPSSPAGRPSASSPSPSPCLLHCGSPWPPTVHGSSSVVPALPSVSVPCPLLVRLDKVRSGRHFPMAARILPSSASHHVDPPCTAPSLASHHAVVLVPPCE
jgi:hypothetical protein